MSENEHENILIAAPLQLNGGERSATRDWLAFHVESLGPEAGLADSWLGTYSSSGGTASFRIELDPPYATDENHSSSA